MGEDESMERWNEHLKELTEGAMMNTYYDYIEIEENENIENITQEQTLQEIGKATGSATITTQRI